MKTLRESILSTTNAGRVKIEENIIKYYKDLICPRMFAGDEMRVEYVNKRPYIHIVYNKNPRENGSIYGRIRQRLIIKNSDVFDSKGVMKYNLAGIVVENINGAVYPMGINIETDIKKIDLSMLDYSMCVQKKDSYYNSFNFIQCYGDKAHIGEICGTPVGLSNKINDTHAIEIDLSSNATIDRITSVGTPDARLIILSESTYESYECILSAKIQNSCIFSITASIDYKTYKNDIKKLDEENMNIRSSYEVIKGSPLYDDIARLIKSNDVCSSDDGKRYKVFLKHDYVFMGAIEKNFKNKNMTLK